MRLLYQVIVWLILASSVVKGAVALRPALNVVRLYLAADDPVRLSDLRLSEIVTPERIGKEIDGAVASEDEELADSLVALAQERDVSVDTKRFAAIEQLKRAALSRRVRNFGSGFVSGDGEDGAAVAGALAGDLVGYGDLRDLWREGEKFYRGEPYDEIVVGLAVLGLGASAATVSSLGLAGPARGGLTMAKAAKKLGRLSRGLTDVFRKVATEAVDSTAMRKAFGAARRLDLSGTRKMASEAVRPAALDDVRRIGGDLGTILGKSGQRGALKAVNLAEDACEVGRAARIAERFGPKTMAVFTLLGRSAFVAGRLGWRLMSWAAAAAGWALLVVLLVWRSMKLARSIFRESNTSGSPMRTRQPRRICSS